jgi:hypothetical protein
MENIITDSFLSEHAGKSRSQIATLIVHRQDKDTGIAK